MSSMPAISRSTWCEETCWKSSIDGRRRKIWFSLRNSHYQSSLIPPVHLLECCWCFCWCFFLQCCCCCVQRSALNHKWFIVGGISGGKLAGMESFSGIFTSISFHNFSRRFISGVGFFWHYELAWNGQFVHCLLDLVFSWCKCYLWVCACIYACQCVFVCSTHTHTHTLR